MSILLFANNATSTVQSPIGPSSVTINLAPGTGAHFPSPSAGQIFIATLTDAATGLIKEIVNCTAISGDVVTVVRAQEGTAAQSWNAGDHFDNLWTAGSAAAMLQQNQVPQFNNYAVDIGAVNTLTITLSPAPLSLGSIIGTPIAIKIAHTNTSTTPTLNVNGFGPQAIKLWNASGAVAIPVGWLPIGEILTFVWDGTQFQIGLELGYATGLAFAGSSPPVAGGSASAGYQYLPSGLIYQWGTSQTGASSDTLPINFAVNFKQQPRVTLTIHSSAGMIPQSKPVVVILDSFQVTGPNWTGFTATGAAWSSGATAFGPINSFAGLNFPVFDWHAIGTYQ